MVLLDERWDDLLSRTRMPNPLLSVIWLRALALRDRTVVPLVGLVEADGTLLVAAAPQVRRSGGRLGPRVATWLGPQAQQHSPDFLVDAARPEAGEALAGALFGEVDALSLDTAESGSAARALAAVAPWRSAVPAWERWLLRVPPPRLDYVRKQTAYDLRRAARLGADVEVSVTSESAEVERALVGLFRVHRDRWRDRADLEPRFEASCAYTAVRVGGALRRPGHLAMLHGPRRSRLPSRS